LGSGATGFPAAAKVYFNKAVAEFNLPEAAMLAGIINAPSHDGPLHDLNASRRRSALVIDQMAANGKLSEQAAIAAKLHPATPNPPDTSRASTGWFVDWIYERAAAVTPPLGGAVHIQTTLDLRLQELAANVVNSTLAKYGREKRVGQATLSATAEAAQSSVTTVGQSQSLKSFDQDSPSPALETQSTQCNVQVCERYYRSFRASDCTYKPYWGQRQICER
jgi:membrane peptidoglycan carboxypeptidase